MVERGGNDWLLLGAQAVALVAFVTVGLLAIPLLGFEDDELIFVNLFWHPNDAFSRLPLFGDYAIPGMAASYAGALKTWLYGPLFCFAAPTVWLVRAPALLLAAFTAMLAGRLLREISGGVAAAVMVLLLTTDATFLLTATFDWGPVLLQHLLWVASLLLMMKWYWARNRRWLFLGGVSVGLALWDKSLFLWQVAGLTVALLVVAFPLLRSFWTRKNLWMFGRGLLLGALPLIAANFRHHFATIRDNGHTSFADVGAKAAFLRSALNGQAATTFFVESGHDAVDHIQRPFEAIALALLHSLGPEPSNWRFYAGLAIIPAGLLMTRGSQRKWILFFLLSGTVAWFQSAITLHAGNVVHHSVLIWMNWYAAVTLSLAALLISSASPVRIAAGVLVALLCVRGWLVMGADYGGLIRHPGTPRWTNADRALADQLKMAGVKRIVAADWGIKNVVRAQSLESIAVDNQGPQLTLGRFDANAFGQCMAPDCVVVEHAPGRNVFPRVAETLAENLPKAGLRKSGTTTVYDTHGVPSFEFSYLKPW